MNHRIGIDLGGTKIEFLLLGPHGIAIARRRIATPATYAEAMDALKSNILALEAEIGTTATIGIGIPGTMDRISGTMRTPNTECMNNQPFETDFTALMNREIRIANDANCFALSEATDGAATGEKIVFGVILGTGCGGGIVVNGQILEGRNSIAGEWGHTPLPWPRPDEFPLRHCPCGLAGCIERYVAGPALAFECDGANARDASTILPRAQSGEPKAQRALAIHAERLARGLAAVTNLLDPDIIVLGGGLSNLPHLYTDLPRLMKPFVFSAHFTTKIVPNHHGDSSGVRGAAWLWPA